MKKIIGFGILIIAFSAGGIFKKPLAEVDNENSISNGSIIDKDREDKFLAILNDKRLKNRQTKDLYTEVGNDGTYCVSQEDLGSEPVSFSFYLNH
jgi:hypothetical protein